MKCNTWISTTIGEQLVLQRGYDISKAEQVEGEVPVISSSGIKSFHNQSKVKGPGVLLGRKGTIGTVYYTESDYWPHSTTLYVKNFQNNNPRFVYYFFQSIKEQLKNMDVGTSNPTLNRNHVHPLNVMWPCVEIQNTIETVLSTLDAKIELNNKITSNLQQQAQAIFKSWFVDFEPFQDGEFVESELGPIPKGWKVGSVADIVNIHDSKRIPLSGAQRQRMEKKVYPYYGAASLMDYVENYIFDGIYLLLGEDGTVMDDKGYPILQYVWGKFWVNNHAHVLTGKCGYSVESLYLLFLNTPVKSIVTGAVQAKISQSNLKAIQVIVPSQEVLDKFNELIQPYFSMIRQKGEENKRLENLRDALLPKLMNGEIDIIKD